MTSDLGPPDPDEDPVAELRKSRIAEAVLASLAAVAAAAAVLTQGWVRLVLGILAGAMGALLAWSLFLLVVIETLVRFLRRTDSADGPNKRDA